MAILPDAGTDDPEVVLRTIVPWAARELPTSVERSDQAIGGISRGGGAALRIVAAHSGAFSKVGGHSPTVDERAIADAGALRSVAVWLDVGDRDPLHGGVLALASQMRAAGEGVDVRVWPGRHDRAYWRSHLTDDLRFYATGAPACAPSS